MWGYYCGIVSYKLDCDIMISKFELRHAITFTDIFRKDMNSLIDVPLNKVTKPNQTENIQVVFFSFLT